MRKQKKSEQTKRTLKVVIGSVLGVSAAVLVFFYVGYSAERLEKRLVTTINGYLRSLPANDVWWLETTPSYSDASRVLFEKKRAEILAGIEKHRSVNALTARICDYAKEMPLASVVRRGEVTKVNVFAAGNGFLITAVPRDMSVSVSQFLNRTGGGTTFKFSPENRCVFFPAIQMSEPFFSSIFMHEYGHGIRAVIDKNVGTKTEEEVLMHELTFAVLSHGIPAYQEKIAGIAARGNPRTFKRAIARVTADDLRELDILVHGVAFGKEVAKYSIMQHLFSVGFAFVERRGLPGTVKGEVYEWMNTINK